MNDKKIIQLVHYKGDGKLLKYRLDTFDDIDYFIVIHNSELSLSFTDFSYLKEKILFLPVESFQDKNEYDKNLFKKISEFLIGFCKNFEDVIFFSEEDEFVDTNKLKDIIEDLTYGPFFLIHTSYWWGRNYVNENYDVGTYVFLFSHLLHYPKLFDNFSSFKETYSNVPENKKISGWCLKGLFSENKSVFANNLLSSDGLKIKLKKVDYVIDLPPNSLNLPLFKPNSQKILIVVGQEKIDDESYTKKVYVNFREGGCEKISVNEDLTLISFEIPLPNKVLYGDKNFDDFIQDFKQNEIKRVVEHVKITEQDIIEIINPS